LRTDLATLRAALWTLRAARSVRKQLGAGQPMPQRLPAVPRVPATAERGMKGVLTRREDTCLVRALVRQAWFAAHGSPRDLVIGVTPPSAGFRAHAWLDGDPPCHDEGYHELVRRPANL
jgi:hypothetical protein